MKKYILILGGGGFIGGNLGKKLKSEGHWVRIVDIKPKHDYYLNEDICNEYIQGDLTDISIVSKVLFSPIQKSLHDKENSFDEIFVLAADMGGAGYIFTGENDANIMHNSALINLNIAEYAVKFNIKKLFYSSSACVYNQQNQLDPDNPNCVESSAYPANPDSVYGWEKLFSEKLYDAYYRNYGLNIRIARFHNIFGPYSTYKGGKEKAPAAMCRKVIETPENDSLEVWGDGLQTRSFLYIDECLNAVQKLMESECTEPVNIGSEEMISINNLAKMAIDISNKKVDVKNIFGDEFLVKYGFICPTGVRGRNSNNNLFEYMTGYKINSDLREGMVKTYEWINKVISNG